MLTTHTALGLCGHCYCELSEYNVHTRALTYYLYLLRADLKNAPMALEVEVEKLRHAGYFTRYFLASYKSDMCEWN